MKNSKTLIIMALTATLLAGCGENNSEKIITKSEIGVGALRAMPLQMTPEVLWAFGRLSDVNVSADGTKIVYGVQYYSVEQNKSNREIFVMNADGSDNQ
ncbi:MAG: peptidase S9, partial [Prevotellaceae bacterium]|nr:peptidase S9 [Prevotellaceae bacterium]